MFRRLRYFLTTVRDFLFPSIRRSKNQATRGAVIVNSPMTFDQLANWTSRDRVTLYDRDSPDVLGVPLTVDVHGFVATIHAAYVPADSKSAGIVDGSVLALSDDNSRIAYFHKLASGRYLLTFVSSTSGESLEQLFCQIQVQKLVRRIIFVGRK